MKIMDVLDLLMMPVDFPERLGHQARLQPHLGVTHLAVDLGFGYQGGHGIHHNHIDGAAAHQGLADLLRSSPVSGCEMSSSSVFTPSWA